MFQIYVIYYSDTVNVVKAWFTIHFDKNNQHIKNEQEMSKIVLHLKIDSRINQYRRP